MMIHDDHDVWQFLEFSPSVPMADILTSSSSRGCLGGRPFALRDLFVMAS